MTTENLLFSSWECGRLQKIRIWMWDNLGRLSFFLWFGLGEPSYSNFLASTSSGLQDHHVEPGQAAVEGCRS